MGFAGTSPTIDYTVYNVIYTEDREDLGLRIRQGEGRVTVSWENLARVDVTKMTESGAEARIVTATGDTHNVVLLPWSKDGLVGETELGVFSISLDKVKIIEVIR